MASENNNKSDSLISQDDIDSLFSSMDEDLDDSGEEPMDNSHEKDRSQVSQDDIDSLFDSSLEETKAPIKEDELSKTSEDLKVSDENKDDISVVSQDDIDSLFDSSLEETKSPIKENELSKTPEDLKVSDENKDDISVVSQDDIDSLFDSSKEEPGAAQNTQEESAKKQETTKDTSLSLDDVEAIIKNPISDASSENKVKSEVRSDFENDDYDFSAVSQDAVDALLEGKEFDPKLDSGSDFSKEMESGEVSQEDIEAILLEANDLGVFDPEEISSEVDEKPKSDSELVEMISQSEIDDFFANEPELSKDDFSDEEEPVFDSANEPEKDLNDETSVPDDQKKQEEEEFVPKEDWNLSQGEINNLLGNGSNEEADETKTNDFVSQEEGFQINQDELDSILEKEKDSPGENKNIEQVPDYESEKGANLLTQEYLDYLEEEFLSQDSDSDDELDVDDVFQDDEISSDGVLSDNDIDELLGVVEEEDEEGIVDEDELDFISQDDINELLGAVVEDEAEEIEGGYQGFSENLEDSGEGPLTQEELDRLLSQKEEVKDNDLEQALVQEEVVDEKTVILEKEEKSFVKEKKPEGKKKKIIVFSAAASFVVLLSASVVLFFLSGKEPKPLVEISDSQMIEEIYQPDFSKPEQIIEPKTLKSAGFVSTTILSEIIVPAPLTSKRYSYFEVDISIDIKGDKNSELLNKNNAFFRGVFFKALDEEFRKISKKEKDEISRDELEKEMIKTLEVYFEEPDAVKGLVFTRFAPV